MGTTVKLLIKASHIYRYTKSSYLLNNMIYIFVFKLEKLFYSAKPMSLGSRGLIIYYVDYPQVIQLTILLSETKHPFGLEVR